MHSNNFFGKTEFDKYISRYLSFEDDDQIHSKIQDFKSLEYNVCNDPSVIYSQTLKATSNNCVTRRASADVSNNCNNCVRQRYNSLRDNECNQRTLGKMDSMISHFYVESSLTSLNKMTINDNILSDNLCHIPAAANELNDQQKISQNKCTLLQNEKDDEIYNRKKRRSSLKSNHTPPEIPGEKKIVRFADAFGLDLTSVWQSFDLSSCSGFCAQCQSSVIKAFDVQKYYSARFLQHELHSNIENRVLKHNVGLEKAVINDSVLSGTIVVKNLCFHKKVHVRFTCNNWLTNTDIAAQYVPNCSTSTEDKFSFQILIPPDLNACSQIQFAIRYTVDTGDEYWDNNDGQNYTYDVFVINAASNYMPY